MTAPSQAPTPSTRDGLRLSLMIRDAGQAWDVLQSRVRGPVCEWPRAVPPVLPHIMV